MFRSFRHYNFRLWWAGILVSNLGVWMQRTAQDWIVLTELTDHNATAVGLTTALQFAPQLILSPLTGPAADRVNRIRLLVVTQSAMLILAAGLAATTLLGHLDLWLMYAFSLGLGVATAFDIPARQSFVGEMVPRRDLTNAVSLNSAAFNSARMIGPAIAGLAVAVVGPGWVFAVNATTFLGMLFAIRALRRDELTVTPRSTGRGQFRDGLRYIRGRPDVVLVMVAMFLFGALGMNVPIITSTMARIEFNEGAEVFGLLGSAVAVGSLTGALLSARRERVRLSHFVLAGSGTALGAGAAAIMPTAWSFGATLAVMGLGTMFLVSSANAYVQTTTPANYRGRVLALYLALFMGATPIGSPIAGWVADTFGPRWTLVMTVVGALIVVVIMGGWMIHLRRHGIPEPTGELADDEPVVEELGDQRIGEAIMDPTPEPPTSEPPTSEEPGLRPRA